MYNLEAAKEGFIAGTMKDVYDEKTKSWTKTGMRGLMDSKAAFAVGGNVSETGYFISNFGGGAPLTGAAGMRNKQYAAAYFAAFEKYGVSQAQFKSALAEAQTKTGRFGSVTSRHRNVTFLSDALNRMQGENIAAKETQQRKKQHNNRCVIFSVMRDGPQMLLLRDAARQRNESDDERGVFSGNEYGFDSSQSFGVGASGGMSGIGKGRSCRLTRRWRSYGPCRVCGRSSEQSLLKPPKGR